MLRQDARTDATHSARNVFRNTSHYTWQHIYTHIYTHTHLPNSCIALALAPNSGTSSTPPSYSCLRRPLSSLVLFFTPFVNFLLFSNAFSFNLISVCSFHFFLFSFFVRFAFFWQNFFLMLRYFNFKFFTIIRSIFFKKFYDFIFPE